MYQIQTQFIERHRYILRKNFSRASLFFICMSIGIMLLGCGETESSQTVSQKEIAYVTVAPNQYDSEDRAIFLGANTQDKTVSFQNASTGKRYTLNYTGASIIQDRYEQDISLLQLKTGAMTIVRFYKPTKNMTFVKEVNDSINYRETEKYYLDTEQNTIQIADQIYKFNQNVTVMSESKEITLQDIDAMDVLTIWGYQDQIYSIHVDKGHGYLKLDQDSYFLNGWVEVGDKVIRKVSEGMRLVVPEGTYRVSISHDGSSASDEFTFVRDEVVTWDLSTAKIAVPKVGKVVFTITPPSAKVYIDGNEVDTSDPVEVKYGIHQLTVKEKGYQTLSKYMKVATAWANIPIELVKEENDKQSEKQDDTAKEETKADTKVEETDPEKNTEGIFEATSAYKIHIDAPADAEVYIDGIYIGITPVEFAKKAGNIVLTLRKSGYQTRSYALEIDEEEKDTTYSFSELEKKD